MWVAGRIIGLIDEGFVLQDESARMDVWYKGRIENERNSDEDGGGEKLAVGDIVEVEFEKKKVLREGKEEEVFWVKEMTLLAPCRREFFIRKENPNYVRMVIDLHLKEKLVQRTKLLQKIRDFFVVRGFVDVETPGLVRLPGMEPYLDVFKTQFVGPTAHQKSLPGQGVVQEDMYLITSPEYALKKLLVAGFEKIFEITKSYRNKETMSELHNPEFTILEWYRAYASYEDIMKDMEELVLELARSGIVGDGGASDGSVTIRYGEHMIDVTGPWLRLKVKDAFKEYAGVSYEDFEDVEKLRKVVEGKGYKVTKETPFEDLFFLLFMNEIEPKLGFDKPVIIYEYPASMAALSKKCAHDPRYAERFEVYIAGMELCNAFTELNDPLEQEARLQQERHERLKMGKEDYAVDQSFLRALQFGMPPSGGIALGVDRLMMLLTNTPDINNILFFPHKDL